jgi:hypothetical protein
MHTNATNIKKDLFSHHAYLLVGDKEYWQKFLDSELKNLFKLESLTSSPDVWWQSYDSFGIKEAHTLIEKEARKSFGGQGRFFVLEISSITPEAQNALLKTFEEPAPDAHFFIIARTSEIFLPTLLSRVEVTEDGLLGAVQRPSSAPATAFLKLDLPDRLDFIQKEFLKSKDKNPARPLGGKSEVVDFVIELEKTLRAKIEMRKITKDEAMALRELEKCQRYLQNPRSSNRLILEHLSLILP